MRHGWSSGFALCFLLTSSCGTPLAIDEDLCIKSAAIPTKTHFTATKHQYLFRGTCHVARMRLDHPSGKPVIISMDAPFTAEGVFEPESGVATEIFTVPEPKISEPSRPYGTFRSSFRCEKDPWLYGVKCVPLVSSVNPPVSAYPGPRYQTSRMFLEAVLSNATEGPYSARAVRYAYGHYPPEDPVVKAWNSFQAAERKAHQLAQGASQAPGTSFRAGLAPAILRPAAGQRFFINTPVPIKLAPPEGWNVAGYMVKLERKDNRGNWIAHTTIPVGAVPAQSPTGYTGFGAGTPPMFSAAPGAWRLSAQVSSPNQSGWSNWIEFHVATPPSAGALGKGSLMRPQ